MIPKREPYTTIFKVFTYLGFWNEVSNRHKMIGKYVLYLCTFGYTSLITLSLLQAEELSDVLDGIKTVPILLTITISLHGFIYKKSEVCELLELIEDLESEYPDSKTYFDEAFRVVRTVFMAEVFFVSLLLVSYCLMPLMLGKLVFPSYIPDVIKDYNATFYVYWIYQSFCGFYLVISHMPIIDIRCSLLIVLDGYMKYFRDKLSGLNSTKSNYEETKHHLATCVKIHLRMKKFLDIYMDIFSFQLSSLLFLCALAVCSNTFIIATFGSNAGLKANIFPIVYEVFVSSLIFIPCFYANSIQYQSDNFLNDLFMSDWIESDVRYQKLVLIFMENLKQKIIFKVAGFVEIDLLLFVQIIKSVYSMYCVLQSMN